MSYQWNAEDYARHSQAQYRWAQALIDQLNIRPGETVLDIGCGDGKVTTELAGRAAPGQVLGVDRSHDMLRQARQVHGPANPNLHFCQQDAARLGLAPIFDVVFSNATLHWVADHPGVLRGVHQALRPGGRILFQMGGAGNAAGILAVLDDLLRGEPWQTYFRNFSFPYTFATPHEYQVWLAQAGLKPARVELLEKDMLQPGRAGLAGWIRTTWLPYLARVPEERKNEFIEQVVEHYLAVYPLDTAGNAHVAMVRLEVEASK